MQWLTWLIDCLIVLNRIILGFQLDFHLIVLHISEDFYWGSWRRERDINLYHRLQFPFINKVRSRCKLTRYKPKYSCHTIIVMFQVLWLATLVISLEASNWNIMLKVRKLNSNFSFQDHVFFSLDIRHQPHFKEEIEYSIISHHIKEVINIPIQHFI